MKTPPPPGGQFQLPNDRPKIPKHRRTTFWLIDRLILKNMFSCHKLTVLGSFCFLSRSSSLPVKPHLNLARKPFCLIQGMCMQQCFTVVSFKQLGTPTQYWTRLIQYMFNQISTLKYLKDENSPTTSLVRWNSSIIRTQSCQQSTWWRTNKH